ncbi:MAG: hypothetical protein RR945_01720 [Erysipelotrichaceae bacterium]
MSWDRFQTYNDSQEDSFETLCNQLFENWCLEEYGDEIEKFQVKNGSGGDGGIESYTVLKNGKMIAMQAKWFRNSLTSSHIKQIKNSILTALSIQKNITKYIICIPRDLSGITGRSINECEEKRYENMVSEIENDWNSITIELWNDFRLTKELQKGNSSGIMRYWFLNSEVNEESIDYSFQLAKNGWLDNKYIPQLNTYGELSENILMHIGDECYRKDLVSYFKRVEKLLEDYFQHIPYVYKVINNKYPCVNEILKKIETSATELIVTVRKDIDAVQNESMLGINLDINNYILNIQYLMNELESNEARRFYFHLYDIIQILKKFDEISNDYILGLMEKSNTKNGLLYIGNPGTGKTHGIAAISEKLLREENHIPILIQAKVFSPDSTWTDIIGKSLGLSACWSSEDVLQGLTALAYRRKIKKTKLESEIKILPKILIVVDAIDESSSPEKWIERISESVVIMKRYPLIKFCFTSRPHLFNNRINNIDIIRINDEGDVLISELMDKYFQAYHIDIEGSEWIKNTLSTPLELKLFCELNQNSKINVSKDEDFTISELFRKKICILEKEFLKIDQSNCLDNQTVFKTIRHLVKYFSINENKIERNIFLNNAQTDLDLTREILSKLLDFLEKYGILQKQCVESQKFMEENKYYYFQGIQGYFDYANSLYLLDKYSSPEHIDFNQEKNISMNSIYILSIISIRKYDFLLTENKSFREILNKDNILNTMVYSLRYTTSTIGNKYVDLVKDFMAMNAKILRTVVNKLILPLCRINQHSLGSNLLDEFLSEFNTPAERDIIWSVPSKIGKISNKWYTSAEIELDKSIYSLEKTDISQGLPLVYAWMLSSLDNKVRQFCRIELLKWAMLNTEEYLSLFLKFDEVNDPQIRYDIYSILMSLVFEIDDDEFTVKVSVWLVDNFLSKMNEERNWNLGIRHYATSIIKKSVEKKLIDKVNFDSYRNELTNNISLNTVAAKNATMYGYLGIDYDLSRYVLYGHFNSLFNIYDSEQRNKLNNIFDDLIKNNCEFDSLNFEQFLISSAFEYIEKMGWNEKEFRHYNQRLRTREGVDNSIVDRYSPMSHGTQSKVMTTCEKYVWQARNQILGFLVDRIPVKVNDTYELTTNYNLLDNFIIPSQELELDNILSKDTDMFIFPEGSKIHLEKYFEKFDELLDTVFNDEEIDWEHWINITNMGRFKIESENLLVLNAYSCSENIYGVDSILHMNAFVIDNENVERFVNLARNAIGMFDDLVNPDYWSGGVYADCYITPKEVCWFPWLKRYGSSLENDFEDFQIHTTSDKCTSNYLEIGDVSYYLPSPIIRQLLDISNTTGYLYTDNKCIKAQTVKLGDFWGMSQRYLVTSESDLREALEIQNKSMFWILYQKKIENGKLKEKYGEKYFNIDICDIGYYNNSSFETIRVYTKKEKW